MKKTLLALGVLVLAFGVILGCTSNELGLYDLSKEASQLRLYEDTGSVTCHLNLKEMMTAEERATMTAADLKLLESLENVVLDYTMKSDMDQAYLEMDLSLSAGSFRLDLGQLVFDQGAYYVRGDRLISLLQLLVPAEDLAPFATAFGGEQWVKLDLTALIDGPQDPDWFNTALQLVDPAYRFGDTLFKEVYRDYNPGIVEKTAHGYQLTIAGDQFGALLTGVLRASIENLEGLLNACAELYGDPAMKDYLLACGFTQEDVTELVTVFRDLPAAITAEDQAEVLALLDDPDFQSGMEEISGYLKDSQLQYSIERSGGKYQIKGLFDLQIDIPDAGKFQLKLTSQDEMSAIREFTHQDTTAAIDLYQTLQRDFSYQKLNILVPQDASQPPEYVLQTKLDVLGNRPTLESRHGNLPVPVIDGRIYLPLQLVSEATGAQMTWVPAAQQVEVQYQGVRSAIRGRTVDGQVYVDARQLEDCGFTVHYDPLNSSQIDYELLGSSDLWWEEYGYALIIQPAAQGQTADAA